jgi:arabinan endo-1,5-alpha-L-arabinosidase
MDGQSMKLAPVPGAPFRYAATVVTGGGALTVSVSADDGEPALSHVLTARDHGNYRSLFRALARRFGTRAPLGAARGRTGSTPDPFRLVLGSAIDTRILYGYGDPAVTRVHDAEDGQDSCYLLVTSNDAPDAFPILRLRGSGPWEIRGFVFPRGSKPGWAAEGWNRSDFWAPELHVIGTRYVVCFAAREEAGGLSIGLAFANHPEGPYETAPTPLLRGGVIDPHILVDDDRVYLYWKEDSNDIWPGLLTQLLREHPGLIAQVFSSAADRRTASLAATLWPWVSGLPPMERFLLQQPLIEAVAEDVPAFRLLLRSLADASGAPEILAAVDGILSALRTRILAQELDSATWQLTGSPVTVLENDRKWEAHLIEGVWITKNMGRYYMFYSGNDFSTPDYGIGAAAADGPLGPFTKQQEPLARSTAQWSGPGHPSVALDESGAPVMFLHAFPAGRTGYKAFRALLSLRLRFEDGAVRAG